MRVSCRVEVNIRTKEVAAAGDGFAEEFSLEMAKTAQEFAKRNVSPGMGPGPHPHRPGWPHVDTGELARSVKVRPLNMGFLKTAIVYTDLFYGAHLEFGWTNPVSGNHWRYPWMWPAMEEARWYFGKIAQSTARRWLGTEGFTYKGRVNLAAPSTATLSPE
jgi:hypothetical protein